MKTDPGEDIIERNSDYFKMPELSSMNKESSIINSMDNNMFLSRKEESAPSSPPKIERDVEEDIEKEDAMYTVEDATHKIRALVDDLRQHGIDIKTNEMNFEKSYQMIIKIEKE